MKIWLGLIIIFFMLSCDYNVEGQSNNPIHGTWIEEIDYENGYSVINQITFKSSNSYELIDKYINEEISLIAKHHGVGQFRIKGNKLDMIELMNKTEKPASDIDNIRARGVFDDCTFVIEENHLILTFTTYPFDGPVETIRRYCRVK